jgi:hypothetical protein
LFQEAEKQVGEDVDAYLAKKDFVLARIKAYRRDEFCGAVTDESWPFDAKPDRALRRLQAHGGNSVPANLAAQVHTAIFGDWMEELSIMADEIVYHETLSALLLEGLREELHSLLGSINLNKLSRRLFPLIKDGQWRDVYFDNGRVHQERSRLRKKLRRLQEGGDELDSLLEELSEDGRRGRIELSLTITEHS